MYVTGVVDTKQTSIKELAEELSVLFNTPLPNIHHTFFRMKNRKSDQTTPFLDALKQKLDDYIQKSNQ